MYLKIMGKSINQIPSHIMRKKILLLDTSFSAKPIYDYLVSTGAEVFVAGGTPDDALAKSIENYVNINYSKIEEVRDLIKERCIDFLVPGGNDLSYKICAELNKEFRFKNIDSIEANDVINNKEKFRRFSTDIHLHVPQIIEIDQISEFLPVIIKPVDAYSGHGMSVLYKADQDTINEAVNNAKAFSKSSRYIIEEFVQGQLFSHSAFIVDGEIMIDFIAEEHCIVNQYVVDTSRVIYDFDPVVLSQIRLDITKMVKELGLVDGLMHTQFIRNGSSFWLIEVTRRCPGDLYSKLIEYSTGFPYAEYYARPFIDNINRITSFNLNESFVFRHTVTISEKGSFNSITMNSPLNRLKFIPLSKTGDRIQESPFSRIGILFGFTDSESDFFHLYGKAINRTLYTLD